MSLTHELRFTVRKSMRNPGFTAILLLLLVLGVATSTVVFSLYNTVALRSLPVEDPAGLLAVYTSGSTGKPYSSSSYPDYEDVRDHNDVFSAMLAYQTRTVNLTHDDGTERIDAELVSANYFELLGVEAYRGQSFGTADVQGPGSAPLAVLGHDYWQRRFSGDESVIGDAVKLNGHAFTVIGVAPPGFRGIELPTTPGVFVPLTMANVVLGGERLADRSSRWIDLVGRLEGGVGEAQAAERIGQLYERLAAEHPEASEGRRMSVLPVQRAMIFPPDREETLDLFALLALSVVLFLLAVCTNVTSILLARGLARQREMAINLSLGAGRRELLRQHLMESVLLAAAAGLLALPVVAWTLRLMSRIELPISYPIQIDFSADWRVFSFAILFALVLGGVLGLLPALRGMRFDLTTELKEVGRGGISRQSRLWSGLVVTQIAATVVLLVTAGLFARSLHRTNRVDPGFDADNVLLMRLDLSHRLQEEGGGAGDAWLRQLLDRVSAAPGVRGAALALDRPLAGDARQAGVWLPGVSTDTENVEQAGLNIVAPGYFRLVGIPLLTGRGFEWRDGPEAPKVAVVSRRMAEHFWPGRAPIGSAFQIVGPDGLEVEVVGVAEDVKSHDLRQDVEAQFYVPLGQHAAGELNLLVRTGSEPAGVAPVVRRRLVELDPDMPIYDVTSLRRQVAESQSSDRVAAAAVALVGLLSLVVGTLGIFGVMSYTVGRRHREFGVRMSLGADRRQIVRLVLGRALLLAGLGVVLGLAGAAMAGRFVESYLFGVSSTDPLTFTLVPLLLVTTVVLASLPPILRAASVDPNRALRYE